MAGEVTDGSAAQTGGPQERVVTAILPGQPLNWAAEGTAMSRVVIIGGTGHVGTYPVPRLVCAGFEVINVSRTERAPYQPHRAWKSVRTVKLSREAEEEADAFGP